EQHRLVQESGKERDRPRLTRGAQRAGVHDELPGPCEDALSAQIKATMAPVELTRQGGRLAYIGIDVEHVALVLVKGTAFSMLVALQRDRALCRKKPLLS